MPHLVRAHRSRGHRSSLLTLATGLLLVFISACTDSTEPQVASTIEIVSAPPATSAAGLPVAPAPAFVVRDQFGDAMEGVAVTVAVTSGSGTLTGAPTVTAAGATPVGSWTLGRTPGSNVITISAGSVGAVTVTVAGTAGPASQLIAQTPDSLTGVVGAAVAVPPRALLADQFGNPVAGAAVTIGATNGSVAATTVTSNAQGIVAVPSWTLGTTKGANVLTMTAGSLTHVFTARGAAGAAATLTVVSGNGQTIFGGRAAAAVRFAVKDQYANTADGVAVTFSTTGGGIVESASAITDADGIVTAPTWTVGKSTVPQELRATVGTLTASVGATIRTSFKIDVRFTGPAMTTAQKELFTAAAARLTAAVIGDIPDVDATGADPAACGVTGQPVLAEVIDDVLIYASIAPIDGPGSILAQAGPCFIRLAADGRLPVVGVMQFDEADLASLTGSGSLQDVITHEMMHVLGFSSFFFNNVGFLKDNNKLTVAHTGPASVSGCKMIGGTVTCASSVPLENRGGAGTANSHWRESTFDNEVMTGFLNSGSNPLSLMTIASFQDIGYQVNLSARDSYTIPGGLLRADENRSSLLVGDGWERPLPLRADLPSIDPAKLRMQYAQPR